MAQRPALPDTTWQARAVKPLGINVDDIARRGIAVASALLVVDLLPKGKKSIFSFFGVLEDIPTMAQCEGLVVIRRLKVLQRLENLHSTMNMASCISLNQRQERKGFYQVNRRDAADLPFFLDLLERPLELATLSMDGAPSLGKGEIILNPLK
jgi:hypothetical protein